MKSKDRELHRDKFRDSIAAYDSLADVFVSSYLKADVSELRERFLASAELESSQLVLDVGCGSGRDTIAFAARGLRAVGLDISQGMLYRARQVAQAQSPVGNWSFLRGDALFLPFSTHAFHATWAMASLVHLSKGQFRIALAEMSRVTRPKGTIYVSVQKGSGPEVVSGKAGTKRYFERYLASEIEQEVSRVPAKLKSLWETRDPFKPSIEWLNILISPL